MKNRILTKVSKTSRIMIRKEQSVIVSRPNQSFIIKWMRKEDLNEAFIALRKVWEDSVCWSDEFEWRTDRPVIVKRWLR